MLSSQRVFTDMENNTEILDQKPRRYLGLAIISTLFFWPLGIVAIIKSLKVDDYNALGNTEMAYYASRDAKRFGIMALIIGLIGWLFIFGLVLAAVLVSIFAAA